MNSITKMDNTENQDESLDILAIIDTLLEYKYFILFITATFTFLGIMYALLLPSIYMANALIQVEQKSGGFPAMNEISEVFGNEASSSTEIELLKSRRVIGVAVDEENLDVVVAPNYFPFGSGFLSRINILNIDIPFLPNINLNAYVRKDESIEIELFTIPKSNYGYKYKIVVDDNENYNLYSPENKLILNGRENELYQKDELKVKITNLHAKPGRVFYLSKLRRFSAIKQYQAALSVSEKGKDTGIIVLSIEDESPLRAERILNLITKAYVSQNVERQSAEAAKSLEFLNKQLPEIEKGLESAENEFNEYQVKAGSVDITVEAESLLNQVVDIESSIATLKLQKAELDRKYTKDHPAYKAWFDQLNSLNSRKDELNERVKLLPHTQQELLGYKRNVQVSTEIYTQMLNNIQELDIVRAGAVGNVRVIDEAAADIESPVRPKKKLIVSTTTILGIFISVVLVFIRKSINRGIKSTEEIEVVDLPIYASIPLSQTQIKLSQSKPTHRISNASSRESNDSTLLLAEEDSTDISIESLRSLRTSLHFAMLETNNNLIMIGGSSPMVGKSFISANLAAVVAQSGKKVLLLDADMRRGYIHKIFGYEPKDGLSDLLVGNSDVNNSIKLTKTENLYVLSRGEIPPNPSELLMSSRFNQFLEYVKSKFDIVIIDTPPILAVTDASIIGQQCGVCLIVARYGFTTQRELQLSKKRFEQNGTKLKGAIFNGIEKSSSRYGYGYYNYSYEYRPKK